MASSSDNNSYDMTATTGWEITPYSSPCGAKNFDSPVQEGTQSCGGLEKAIVPAPNPLSVNLAENVATPQPQPLLVQEPKPRKGRCLTKAKVVSGSYISFNYFKSRADPFGYDLRMYEVGSAPEMEETMPGMTFHDHIFPFPALLRNWKRETRERPNGAQDKFYFHPMCTRMFRSLVEVMNFIRSNNNVTSNENETNAQELQGPQQSEASIIRNDKKRKYHTSVVGSDSKKRRIFPVSWRPGMETKDESRVRDFFDDAYTNLMKFRPSTPEPAIIEEGEKVSVEAFLLDAHANLLNGTTEGPPSPYQKGTGPEDEEMDDGTMNQEVSEHALQNLEPQSETQEGAGNNIIPEPPSQQGGIGKANADEEEATKKGLTDEEMEVVEMFSQGLGSGGNMNNQQDDEEEIMDYSHLLMEPIPPPGLFDDK